MVQNLVRPIKNGVQAYVSDLPLIEEFEVEIKPSTQYDIEDDRNKCHVTLDNDLGPGIIEFDDPNLSQMQSKGNLLIRLNRFFDMFF